MRKSLQILGWTQIILGVLSLFSWADKGDGYALIGGALFIAAGWVALAYINEVDERSAK